MINKLGLSVGFFLSFFLHFGFIVFAFLYFKEQSYEKTELFHKISLNDFILPPEKQADTKAPEPMQESKPIAQPISKPISQPKPTPKAKSTPDKVSTEAKASSVAKQENTAQSSQTSNQAQSQSLAKQEQDEIAAQIYKILLAYISKNYPKDALRKAQSGSVLVSFDFGTDGVKNIQIAKSSKIASLDNASIKAIEKTKHLFPKTNKNFAFELPIRFAIK